MVDTAVLPTPLSLFSARLHVEDGGLFGSLLKSCPTLSSSTVTSQIFHIWMSREAVQCEAELLLPYKKKKKEL